MTTLNLHGLYLESGGDGPPVVCIHGLGGSSNNWTPVLPAFDGKRIVRPDLPGSARSPLPPDKLSIEMYVETVANVLETLDVTHAHVVAHSMGTIVAQHLAIKYPERVKSLAFFGPLLCPPDQGRLAIRARAGLAREKGVAGMQEIADAIVKGATSAQTKAERPVALALVRESVMRQLPEGYAQSCEALADAQAAPIEQIRVPTLLVTGDEDGVGPPAAVQGIGERIPESRVIVLSGCGHWTTFEKPAECTAALREFYETIA